MTVRVNQVNFNNTITSNANFRGLATATSETLHLGQFLLQNLRYYNGPVMRNPTSPGALKPQPQKQRFGDELLECPHPPMTSLVYVATKIWCDSAV